MDGLIAGLMIWALFSGRLDEVIGALQRIADAMEKGDKEGEA